MQITEAEHAAILWLAAKAREEALKTFPNGIIGVQDAPSSLRGMVHWAQLAWKGMKYPVFAGNLGDTIYQDFGRGLYFRAWHDSLHVKLHKTTSLDDELDVAQAHVEACHTPLQRALVYADTAGHTLAFWMRGRKYVRQQRAFTMGLARELHDQEVFRRYHGDPLHTSLDARWVAEEWIDEHPEIV